VTDKSSTSPIVVIIFVLLLCMIFLGGCANPNPTETNIQSTLTLKSTNTSTPIPTETPIPASSTPDNRIIFSDKDHMSLLHVPAGEFTMGADSRFENEMPAHRVYLDEFWIDQTEVTVHMYSLCVTAKVCKKPSNKASSLYSNYYGSPEFEDYPVIHVDWNMAKTYCEWTGRRLPTEAEWEKAARGEQSLTYPWGNEEPNGHLLNFDNQKRDVTAVGSYPNGSSPYGALDMAGNAWEWVADWYRETYYASSPASNPLGPNSGQERVLKGGSWRDNSILVRSSNRNHGSPEDACVSCGFRCAVSR
jgi:formylglycine-generating enzyme required for sulfatase activity